MKENEYMDCYIAFLDLLGFKDMLKNQTTDKILGIYEQINSAGLRTMYRKGEKLMEDYSVHKKVMSDSICLYVDKDALNAFLAIIAVAISFQTKMLENNPPIFLRGAITEGKMYAKGDVNFGPGLTDAYLMEEKMAKFPRIIFSEEIINSAKEKMNENAKSVLDALISKDDDKLWCTDYIGFLKMGENKEHLEKVEEFVQEKLACNDLKYFESSIRSKYLYVLNKIESALKE